MSKFNITIFTDGDAPFGKLKARITAPAEAVLYDRSPDELKERIDGYPAQIQALQDQQAADQAMYDALMEIANNAGVADTAAPLSPQLNGALEAKNNEANAIAIQARIDSDKATLASAAAAAIA